MFVLIAFAALLRDSYAQEYSQKVLLISFDGFRESYIRGVPTPNFDLAARAGVTGARMQAPFVTKTFPSHFSIVTGMNEESHGIVNNYMYDPQFGSIFTMGTVESRWWNNGGEPVWVTAKKAGLKCGTYFWPGSEVEFDGVRPDIWLKYNKTIPFGERVSTAIDWLLNRDMNLVTVYFDEPDHTGHQFGPDSSEILSKVFDMDSLLGTFIAELNSTAKGRSVNVIVLSDHGMAATSEDMVTSLDEIVDISKIKFSDLLGFDPIAQIWPVEGANKTEMYEKLKASEENGNYSVWLKGEIPERFHYNSNRRIPPILLAANEGWLIAFNKSRHNWFVRGAHGYDNELESMRPIFFAFGPDIRKNYIEKRPFSSTDVYELMCSLLKIAPHANNGSLSVVGSFLRPPPESNNSFKLIPFSLTLLFTSFVTNLSAFCASIFA